MVRCFVELGLGLRLGKIGLDMEGLGWLGTGRRSMKVVLISPHYLFFLYSQMLKQFLFLVSVRYSRELLYGTSRIEDSMVDVKGSSESILAHLMNFLERMEDVKVKLKFDMVI